MSSAVRAGQSDPVRRVAPARLGVWFDRLRQHLDTLWQSRPVIEPSAEAADCGYVCISAVMALLGRSIFVEEVKRLTGTTSRGLTLRQVRDALRLCGAEAEVIFYDRSRAESFPRNGIVLLTEGHYIVTCRTRGDRIEIFDPQGGWMWTSRRRLARRCGGFAINVAGLVTEPDASTKHGRAADVSRAITSLLRGRLAWSVLSIFAFAQAVTLLLPLLSLWSVDRSMAGVSFGLAGVITIGFAALSLTNILATLVGDLSQYKARRVAAVALSRMTFDALAARPAQWFEANTSAGIHNRVNSCSALLDFHIELIRTLGTLAITLIVGVAVLFFVSPWLLIPGLISLGLSILLDLIFERLQRSHFASVVDMSQRHQWFVLDTLSQLPVIARFGALSTARRRFASVTRGAETAQAQLKSLQGWQLALRTLVKSADTLVFVTIAAAFMGKGDFTVGGFVALGAYKDLLATAIAGLFGLHIERRNLEVHRLQAGALLATRDKPRLAPPEIEHGDIAFRGVAFSYGTLDRPVLRDLDLEVKPGECVVIRGPSGIGKSTVAKLLTGQLFPSEGSVEIDGLPVTTAMSGVGAVLQSDRLITGSIRDNLVYFRPGVSDEEVMAALRIAALDDFVLRLPMRLSTQVGEAVSGLSGGQRQRLLIARAVVGRPRLLILDEATSSLEVDVEAAILDAVKETGATLVLIAHRPEVWRLADRIYSLDAEGRLTEEAVSPRRQSDSVG